MSPETSEPALVPAVEPCPCWSCVNTLPIRSARLGGRSNPHRSSDDRGAAGLSRPRDQCVRPSHAGRCANATRKATVPSFRRSGLPKGCT